MGDRLRGHEIRHDGEQWRYADTGEPTIGNRRACAICAQPDTPEGHDPCLGNLPGVINACCGHGDFGEAYVEFEHGVILRGFTRQRRLRQAEADKLIEALQEGRP